LLPQWQTNTPTLFHKAECQRCSAAALGHAVRDVLGAADAARSIDARPGRCDQPTFHLGCQHEAILIQFDPQSLRQLRQALRRGNGIGEDNHVEVLFCKDGPFYVLIYDMQRLVAIGSNTRGAPPHESGSTRTGPFPETIEALAIGTDIHVHHGHIGNAMVEGLIGMLKRVHATEARTIAKIAVIP